MLALWQFGCYRVTAMFTTLPYNRFQFSCAKTNLYLNLIYHIYLLLALKSLNQTQQTVSMHQKHELSESAHGLFVNFYNK